MQNPAPFLCFLTDSHSHHTLCLRYWAVDAGMWVEKFDALAKDTGLSRWEMQEVLKRACRAYLPHLRCTDCGVPIEVSNRSQYSPLTGKPVGSSHDRYQNLCDICRAAALAADKEADLFALERHRDHVAQALARTEASALAIDYSTLSYAKSFFLYAALVAANVGWEENSIASLDSQPGELAPTPELSQRIYDTLYQDQIILPSTAADPRVFRIDEETGSVTFPIQCVAWRLAPDAAGRSMNEVFSLLLDRLEHPEPEAVEQLWYMIAEAECQRYFTRQCERYRFAQPDIYSAKVASAVRDYLAHLSIGQMWNIIFYVLKDLAALSQEKTYARQHVYNMIPGNIRRYIDYRLGNHKSIRPWSRPAPVTECWMTSILLDKVLGGGDESFETLAGKSVSGHVARLSAVRLAVEQGPGHANL
jgi:hypothetical protein